MQKYLAPLLFFLLNITVLFPSGFMLSEEMQNQTEAAACASPRLTLSMIVKNEADKYLRRVLISAREYITDAVIIDDASDDATVQVCTETLQGIPLTLIKNSSSKFSNEVVLRKQQWDETIKTNPDWILVLDADEIFEDAFKDKVHALINQPGVDIYYFRLYDFWDEVSYREDSIWKAHSIYRPFLVRYKPEVNYLWRDAAQHSGRLPFNVTAFSGRTSELRLKHYGWARKKDRIAKYSRYMKLDPEGKFGSLEQYRSILDENPRLIRWCESS